MRYSNTFLGAFGYELAPVVVSTAELEEQLRPVYERLHLSPGQIEALTGITERRWWDEGDTLSGSAARAARKALESAEVRASDVEVLIYAGVCREDFEPATACHVAAELGISDRAVIFDISNACLGVLNGILEVANRIELGQIRAGLVVSSESARTINELAIRRMNDAGSMEVFTSCLATMTGGSGSAAVLITDGSIGGQRRRLRGGVIGNDSTQHRLCRWGIQQNPSGTYDQTMDTDSVGVLNHGVELGTRTWRRFLQRMDWTPGDVDKVICHQVGEAHQNTILSRLGISPERDFVTYPFLGNIGTVSVPLTAAIAEERGFLSPGDRVGFLGIGSGLNCLMLGWEW